MNIFVIQAHKNFNYNKIIKDRFAFVVIRLFTIKFSFIRWRKPVYVHINMRQTFSPRWETIRLSFYSGHAFESANSSQRVIIGLAMYDTFNTRAHGGVTPQPNENINCQCRGSNHGSPDWKTELLCIQPWRFAVAQIDYTVLVQILAC